MYDVYSQTDLGFFFNIISDNIKNISLYVDS